MLYKLKYSFNRCIKFYKVVFLIISIVLMYLLIMLGRSFGSDMNGPLASLPLNAWSVVVTPVLIIGFLAGFLIYTKLGSRAGGVVIVPLAVVESLAYPFILPFLIIGSIASYMVGMIFFEEFLIYGRRLFYVFLIASILIMTGPIVSTIPHAFNFSTILPGIIAYNMHVEKAMTRSIAIVLVCFTALFILGLLIIDSYRVISYV